MCRLPARAACRLLFDKPTDMLSLSQTGLPASHAGGLEGRCACVEGSLERNYNLEFWNLLCTCVNTGW